MKRKTAKEILAESFFELAATKNVDKITVKDITSNCGYSQATFYRQFRDKYDLIAWADSMGTANIMNKVGTDGYEWRDTLLEGARVFWEKKEYLANLFLHTSGMDSFIHYKTDLNYEHLKACVKKAMGNTPMDEATDMYIRTYVMGTVSLTCEWVLGKYSATPEEMAEIYEKSLPEPLKKYLY